MTMNFSISIEQGDSNANVGVQYFEPLHLHLNPRMFI